MCLLIKTITIEVSEKLFLTARLTVFIDTDWNKNHNGYSRLCNEVREVPGYISELNAVWKPLSHKPMSLESNGGWPDARAEEEEKKTIRWVSPARVVSGVGMVQHLHWIVDHLEWLVFLVDLDRCCHEYSAPHTVYEALGCSVGLCTCNQRSPVWPLAARRTFRFHQTIVTLCPRVILLVTKDTEAIKLTTSNIFEM